MEASIIFSGFPDSVLEKLLQLEFCASRRIDREEKKITINNVPQFAKKELFTEWKRNILSQRSADQKVLAAQPPDLPNTISLYESEELYSSVIKEGNPSKTLSDIDVLSKTKTRTNKNSNASPQSYH